MFIVCVVMKVVQVGHWLSSQHTALLQLSLDTTLVVFGTSVEDILHL